MMSIELNHFKPILNPHITTSQMYQVEFHDKLDPLVETRMGLKNIYMRFIKGSSRKNYYPGQLVKKKKKEV